MRDIHLTEREQDVLRLYCTGLQLKEIAARLELSPKTVKNIRHRLGYKLGVHTTPQLILHALKTGLVPLHPVTPATRKEPTYDQAAPLRNGILRRGV